MTVVIGSWVAGLTRAHYVESVIDDQPITRCGRRLRNWRPEDDTIACAICAPPTFTATNAPSFTVNVEYDPSVAHEPVTV